MWLCLALYPIWWHFMIQFYGECLCLGLKLGHSNPRGQNSDTHSMEIWYVFCFNLKANLHFKSHFVNSTSLETLVVKAGLSHHMPVDNWTRWQLDLWPFSDSLTRSVTFWMLPAARFTRLTCATSTSHNHHHVFSKNFSMHFPPSLPRLDCPSNKVPHCRATSPVIGWNFAQRQPAKVSCKG